MHKARKFSGQITLCAMLVVACSSPGGSREASVDVLIKDGTVYDGTRDGVAYKGDIAIAGDRIAYVGPHASVSAKKVIEARGMIVAPGFIDPHTHPEAEFFDQADPHLREVPAWIRQGVSTILVGVDGIGQPDAKKQLHDYFAKGLGPNVGTFVGFGFIRQAVLGNEARAPTKAELSKEKALVIQGMCEGALGFSTGLWYAPQSFSKTDEVIALAREAAKRGGMYVTHPRDEADFSIGVVNSTKEALEIGRAAGMPVVISHIKVLGPDVWGKSADVIKLVNDARAAGQTVFADQYPYPANETGLSSQLLPIWALDGGTPAMEKRLADPALSARLKTEMEGNLLRSNGAHAILLIGDVPWSGKYLDELAGAWKVSPVEAAIRVLKQKPYQAIAGFSMKEADIEAFMKQPWTVTGSDGATGHPRMWGTFAHKYDDYVRKRHVLSLGAFIRQSTGLTADIYGLDHRGYLKPGYYADVVVFDPNTYSSPADYVHWDRPAVGVKLLLVNGKVAVDQDNMVPVLSGRPLLHAPIKGGCAGLQ